MVHWKTAEAAGSSYQPAVFFVEHLEQHRRKPLPLGFRRGWPRTGAPAGGCQPAKPEDSNDDTVSAAAKWCFPAAGDSINY